MKGWEALRLMANNPYEVFYRPSIGYVFRNDGVEFQQRLDNRMPGFWKTWDVSPDDILADDWEPVREPQ